MASNNSVAGCFSSDDGGQAWDVCPSYIDLPMRGSMEPKVEDLKDGRMPIMSYPDYRPTLIFNDAKSGIGVIPIDEVYVVLAAPYVEKVAAGSCTENSHSRRENHTRSNGRFTRSARVTTTSSSIVSKKLKVDSTF